MQSGSDFIDYYKLLKVHPTAEISEIRQAYIVMAKKHHPDAGGSTDKMKQLNKAYKTLMSSTAKASYDMLHSFHTGTTKPSDYRYHDGREVNDVTDMTDSEIDSFLDGVLNEYRDGPSKEQSGLRQWLKNVLDRV
jgi:curved DNA-binding protein CbpA